MKKYLPNSVTFLGIILSFWVNVLIWSGYHNWSNIFILVALAAVTDLDGRLARSLKSTTLLGRSLDRWRDKVLTLPVFLFLFFEVSRLKDDSIWTVLIMIALVCIVVTELGLIGSWAYGLYHGLDISSHRDGKVKMVLYVITILSWLLFRIVESNYGHSLPNMESISMTILLGLSVLYANSSLDGYMERYFPQKMQA